MAACGEPGEDAALYAAVRAVGEEFCPALGIAIPVGKDSLSMKTEWQDNGEARAVIAPMSLIVSAFAPVRDVRRTLTPRIADSTWGPRLCFSSIWAKDATDWELRPWLRSTTCRAVAPADMNNADLLRRFAAALSALRERSLLLAYHDRADGGLAVDSGRNGFCQSLRTRDLAGPGTRCSAGTTVQRRVRRGAAGGHRAIA